MKQPRTLILIGMILAAALSRLLPHPPNFAPITAIALFGGATFASRTLAFLVPLTALFISDAALEVTTRMGLYSGWLATGRGFHRGMWVVYGTFVLIVVIGFLLRNRKTVGTTGAATLFSSLVFYLITNFAVWIGSTMYSQDMQGLLTCYIAGIPFFGWALAGDLFYVTVLFGSFALAERWVPDLKPAAEH